MIATSQGNHTFKQVTIQHLISIETARNLLVSAFEGGSNYWMSIFQYIYPHGTKREDYIEDGSRAVVDTLGHVWHPAYVLTTIKDGGLVLWDTENEKHTLTREKLLNGFDVMAQKYPHHFRNIVDENDDAETADVLLQCALFGEIIYG